MSVGKKLNKKDLLSTNLATKHGYCTQRWCYAFGFACRSYQLSTKLSAKLTYSTCYVPFFIHEFNLER